MSAASSSSSGSSSSGPASSGSTSGVSSSHTANTNQPPTTGVGSGTPSPSDSAVGDLESMLKEKDSEIVYLRETMEQNEQVIFKVNTWEFGGTIYLKEIIFEYT